MADGQQTVFAHLVVDGAAAAADFYKKALGATETMRMPADDGKRLLHAEIEIGGTKVFLMDDFPEYHGGKSSTPKALGGSPVSLHIEVANCDEAVKRAEQAGATVTMAPADMFWGARYGQVSDPFGHTWSFSHMLPERQGQAPGQGGKP